MNETNTPAMNNTINTPSKHETIIRIALGVYMDSQDDINNAVRYITGADFDQYSQQGWKLVSMMKRSKYSAGNGAGMTSKEKGALTRALKALGI